MRGGKREGAGRKPLDNPRKRLVLYVTDEEQQAIKAFLGKLRDEESPADIEPIESSAVESEVSTSVTADEWIIELERLNHGMTKGKWNCIAGILNKDHHYDSQLEPWTAESIRKKFYKIRNNKE